MLDQAKIFRILLALPSLHGGSPESSSRYFEGVFITSDIFWFEFVLIIVC